MNQLNNYKLKVQTLTLFIGLLFNSANAQQTNTNQIAVEFDKLLSGQFKPNETGAAVLIARNGKVVYKKGVGMANLELNVPMKADNVFRIGSVTKQFTAIAILQLMEQGKLSLQDEITRFIPGYPTQGNKITIEHLLTHTSGIKSYTSMKDYPTKMPLDMMPSEMIDYFKNQPMEFEPGTKLNYNNSGYFLLGYIIEKITSKTYGEYLEENIFKPLSMSHSYYGSNSKIIRNRVGTYTRDDNGYENARLLSMTQPYSAGSIQTTVEDLFKWHRAVQSYKLIKKETLEKAFTRYKLADGSETDYGYGWRFGYVQDSPSIEHGGGINGAMSFALYLPAQDVYVVVLSNCDCYRPEDIAVKLAATAIGKSYQFKKVNVEKNILQEYTGVYENKNGEQRFITLSDNQLQSQRGAGEKYPVKAYAKDKFFFDDVLATIEFSRDASGKITKATTLNRNAIEIWNKTNKLLPAQVEIKVDEKILDTYVGEYEINPDFTSIVTKEKDRLFVQATGQEKFEVFAETQTRFYMKVNDARLEFVKEENTGKIVKVILQQSGRKTDAKKIK